MATHRPTLGCLLALACCACSAESGSPTRPDPLPLAVQPRPGAAQILLSSSSFPGAAGEPLTSLTMLRGSSRTVQALAFDGGGTYLGRPNGRVVWATSDAAVVEIRPTGGWGVEIMAAAPGVARLVANLDGLSAEASITIVTCVGQAEFGPGESRDLLGLSTAATRSRSARPALQKALLPR